MTASREILSVRRATASDVEVLVSLMQDYYAEANFPLDLESASSSFHALLANADSGCVWLAHPGTQPVGHAVLTVRHTMEHGGLSGYVDDLFVQPPFRRAGVGRAMLAQLFAEARCRGCSSVQVEVGASNVPALALYSKHGLAPSQDDRLLLSGVLSSIGN
jgi:ribosomal protein S18 acetylase RimI-like enzyme